MKSAQIRCFSGDSIYDLYVFLGKYAREDMETEPDHPDHRARLLMLSGGHVTKGIRTFFGAQPSVIGTPNTRDVSDGYIIPEYVTSSGEPCFSVSTIVRFHSWLAVQIEAGTLKYGPEQLLYDPLRIVVEFLIWYRFDERARDDGRPSTPGR